VFNSQAGLLLQRIQTVTLTSPGGIYERLDQNRALLELLKAEAPALLEQHPTIAKWIGHQHEFMLNLLAASQVKHFLPIPFCYPRLSPVQEFVAGAAQQQLQLEV